MSAAHQGGDLTAEATVGPVNGENGHNNPLRPGSEGDEAGAARRRAGTAAVRVFKDEGVLEHIRNALQAVEGIKPHDQSPRDVESYLLDVSARLMAAATVLESEAKRKGSVT